MDIGSLDRRLKWWLLFVSVATLLVLIIAALRENVFMQWQFVRREYAKLLRKKATDEHGRKIADQFEIRVLQNVLPGLGTVDRCVTCHAGITDPRMVNEKQPFRTHPGEYLKSHPPEKYGCTVCHRGQGRALVFDEAKAEGHFWDYPLLPREYLTAECGRCHTQVPFAPPGVLREGKRLFSRARCVDCHRLDDVGPRDGYDLSTKGFRLLGRKWWAGHPEYGPALETGRPALAELGGKESAVLQEFLLSRNGAPQLALGQQLYNWYGCGGCHKIRGAGGSMGPDLTSEGRKTKGQFSFVHILGKHDGANWLYEHFLDPARVTPLSKMPRPPEMSREEAAALTIYMLSLRTEPDLPQRYIPPDARMAARGEPSGQELFLRYCSACHGQRGEGKAATSFARSVPGILNPSYLRIAQPDYIRDVAQRGRPERDMPSWKESLDRTNLEAILAFVESQRAQPLPYSEVASHRGDLKRGAELFARNCAICHGDEGEGAIGPRLKSATFLQLADSRFLYETIVNGRPYTPMPAWAADLSAQDLADLLGLFGSWRDKVGSRPIRHAAAVPQGAGFRGAELYATNCAGCHGDRGQGGWAVALQNPVLLKSASPEYLAYSTDRCREWATDPQSPSGHPGGPPPLAADKLGEIVAFLQSWRNVPRLVAAHEYRPARRGDPSLGATLFERNCAGCHGNNGIDGVAPAIGNPRLLQSVPDGFLVATIALGRSNTIMLPRGLNAPLHTAPLNAKEILHIVAYLRSLQGSHASLSTTLTSRER